MSFLAGHGEMSKRIREFDWHEHPIGAPENWPESLRSALGICLGSAFPTAIYWGSDLRLLYNDAWSHIPGPRHPSCLGEPAETVWSDIWHVIEPQFQKVVESGEGLFVDDQMLPMRRYGYEEETFWSYNFTPIRGADGTIEGIFNSGQESTAKVLKQRHTAFLLSFADSLRTETDITRLTSKACQLLGEHLNAIRVGLRETAVDKSSLDVVAEWTADGICEAGPQAPWSRITEISDQLKAGHIVRIENIDDLEGAGTKVLADLGAGSALAIPWHRSGGLHAALFVHRAKPQLWMDEDVAAAEQVLARLMQEIDQKHAIQREKTLMNEVEHRAQNMLGVTMALISQTPGDDIGTYRESLTGRVRALGNTLRVLSESQWSGGVFRRLIEQELAPFIALEDEKVVLEGPHVEVSNMKVQPVAMAVHELVTNSVKYGALSADDGGIQVCWALQPDDTLTVDWIERFAERKKDVESAGTGFGTRLLDMTIKKQLGGNFSRQIGTDELRCILEIPNSQGT